VLGPLEAVRDGVPLALGGSRPRAVLATLLLAGGRRVSVDALVDAVWGDAPPDTAVKTVQKYVSFLRARLDSPDLIASRADGYQLVTDAVDAHSLADLVARASAEPSPERAIVVLSEALDLWRGEPYADLPDACSSRASASGSRTLPASVSQTSRLVRSNSLSPRVASRRATAWLTAGWDRPRSRAAREKLRWTATPTKQPISLSGGLGSIVTVSTCGQPRAAADDKQRQ